MEAKLYGEKSDSGEPIRKISLNSLRSEIETETHLLKKTCFFTACLYERNLNELPEEYDLMFGGRATVKPEQLALTCHLDDRGFLYQIYGSYEDKFPSVKRIYLVGNFSKGTIRGFHKHMDEWKCYFVSAGAAKFVAVDEDNVISNYILSPKNPTILVVPPRYFHGWVSLEDNTILIGMSNKALEASLKDDVRVDPFTFGKDVWDVRAR